jgi:DNA repair exonuclease SbcCD ATPase subunit
MHRKRKKDPSNKNYLNLRGIHTMKIIEFRAERFKRLSAVEITPAGNTVIISGKNGQGKSSVLDAIWLALGGGAAAKNSETSRPIKEGEKDAVVRLDLGDIIVTRKWTASGSNLVVEGADGRKYNSPQSLLDTLVGAISFDPLSFAKMPAAEQRAQLISLANLSIDLDKIDAERKELYDRRTLVNRELKALEGELSNMPTPAEGVPEKEISLTDYVNQINTAIEQRNMIRAFFENLREKKRKAVELEARITAQIKELEALSEEIEKDDEASKTLIEPDVDAMREKMGEIEATNAAVRAKMRYFEIKAKAERKAEMSESITKQIEHLDKVKKDALLEAKFPVEGLSVDADGVTYNGIPFGQCSSAEQLKVCVAIAAALNPKIRVIRVADASLLDEESMQMIQTLAEEQDIQIWLERVTDGKDPVGVVIEDGTVKAWGNNELIEELAIQKGEKE